MHEKHTEFSALMVVALVLVAASAITQTAIGLQGDSDNAALAERALGAVVAAAGDSTNPKIKQYTDQLYQLRVDNDGKAQVVGRIVSKNGLKFAIQTWGGTWSVSLPTNAAQLPDAGALAKVPNFAIGDFVAVNGKAEKLESNTLIASYAFDITASGGRSHLDQTPARPPLPATSAPAFPVEASGTPAIAASGTPMVFPQNVGPEPVSQIVMPTTEQLQERVKAEMNRLGVKSGANVSSEQMRKMIDEELHNVAREVPGHSRTDAARQ